MHRARLKVVSHPRASQNPTVGIDDYCADLEALMLTQETTLKYLKSVTEKYLDQSGRRWVQMSALFSFMNL